MTPRESENMTKTQRVMKGIDWNIGNAKPKVARRFERSKTYGHKHELKHTANLRAAADRVVARREVKRKRHEQAAA